jgi:hypothetical protein
LSRARESKIARKNPKMLKKKNARDEEKKARENTRQKAHKNYSEQNESKPQRAKGGFGLHSSMIHNPKTHISIS